MSASDGIKFESHPPHRFPDYLFGPKALLRVGFHVGRRRHSRMRKYQSGTNRERALP